MKRGMGIFLLFGMLVVAGLAVVLLLTPRDIGAQDTPKQPTIIPVDQLIPAPTPSDGREVALLTLVIAAAEDGTVRQISLETAQAINSYAPNVLNRPGEWTIEVVGRETLRYGIENPLRLHPYPTREELAQGEREVPAHAEEFVAGSIRVDLVVPLYMNDVNLEATEINIYDQNGDRIFSTPVDKERWRNLQQAAESTAETTTEAGG